MIKLGHYLPNLPLCQFVVSIPIHCEAMITSNMNNEAFCMHATQRYAWRFDRSFCFAIIPNVTLENDV